MIWIHLALLLLSLLFYLLACRCLQQAKKLQKDSKKD